MKRSARNMHYRCIDDGFLPFGKGTNWRYILARKFKMPIEDIRRILEEK